MSRLTNDEVRDLHVVADEIFETWGERGHHVGVALETDSDFRTTEIPRSALSRSIVKSAFVRGARKASIWYEPGPGGSHELHSTSADVEHVFRLLKAKIKDEDYVIPVKDDAMLTSLEVTLLGRQERWVFAYTMTGDDIGEIFVAEVIGVVEGSPGRLILGPRTVLGTLGAPPTGRGFVGEDEDLEWFDDDLGEEDGGFMAGGA